MQRPVRLLQAVGVAAAAATVLAACGSGGGGGGGGNGSNAPKATSSNQSGGNQNVGEVFNAATIGWVNKTSSPTGGTINILSIDDCDSWDPANTYYAWCWNMQRLFTRTLVGFSSIPGANNVKIEPDMAQSLGQHNSDFTQWTYKLKPGLKYADGSTITTADIKYGIERLFATDVINGGPSSYYIDTIQAPSGYAGPYKSGDLSSISTPDSTTITFNLKKPYSDFDYLMSLPASAPVPKAQDKGAQYTLNPASSGPFQFTNYTPKKSVTFVKNPNFDQSTDNIIHPLADKIVLTVDSDPNDIDQKLKAGQADAEADNGVQPTFQSQIISDPNLKKNADDPVTGFTRYFAVMQTVSPLDNVHCRRAIAYALDKRALQRARGGTYGGDIANVMTPPIIPGFDGSANPYPDGSDDTGDIQKAKSELQQCGQPNGFSIKEAYSNTGRAVDVFNASQQALGRVGIKVQPAASDAKTYYSKFIGSPANIKSQGLGLGQAGWGADFPTGLGFWNSIANGANILPTGNSNYPSLNDPVVNNILNTVTKSSGTHAAEFKQLDQQVMQDAVYIPFVYDKTLFYRNPSLVNVRNNFAYGGYYDFANMGIKGS